MNSHLAKRSDKPLKMNMVVVSLCPPSRQNSPTENVRSRSSSSSDVLVWDEIEARKRRMNKTELFDIIEIAGTEIESTTIGRRSALRGHIRIASPDSAAATSSNRRKDMRDQMMSEGRQISITAVDRLKCIFRRQTLYIVR